MKPSNNLYAIVRAFDLATPYAADRQQLKMQAQEFLEEISPLIPAVKDIVLGYHVDEPMMQDCFDALLSVAYDAGIDALYVYGLSDVMHRCIGISAFVEVFSAVPSFQSQLRPELRRKFSKYHIEEPSRRQAEAELIFGSPYFGIGPSLDDRGVKVFGPTVLHPFYKSFYKSSFFR